EPGYVARQLCLQALEWGIGDLADAARERLRAEAPTGPIPEVTTRRVGSALMLDLGFQDGVVWAVAVLPDGRVVSGGDDGRVRLWDPARPGDSAQLVCSATAFGTTADRQTWQARLVMAHPHGGVSVWSLQPIRSPS